MKKVLSFILVFVMLLGLFAVATSAATKLVSGYYVVGTMNNWSLNKDYLMRPYLNGHYILYQTTLGPDDALKVVYSADGLTKSVWYPDGGADNNDIPGVDSDSYTIEFAPNGNGEGDEWHHGYIKVYPCEPSSVDPVPIEPEEVKEPFTKLWESGAELTAADIEEAVNDQFRSQKWITADQITICNAHRFDCTPAYIVDYEVEGYGIYLTVIREEMFGDYLFYSPSSYEPSIFVDNKLYSLTKAYEAGILTDEMLRELVETEYKGGNKFNRCKIITRYVVGDADGDGDVTVIDALQIQRYAAKMIDRTAFYEPLADVDRSSATDIVDAVWVQRHVARMCDLNDLPL